MTRQVLIATVLTTLLLTAATAYADDPNASKVLISFPSLHKLVSPRQKRDCSLHLEAEGACRGDVNVNESNLSLLPRPTLTPAQESRNI